MKKCLKHEAGFTLIELIVFIMISGLLMSTMLVGMVTTLRTMPATHNQWVAIQSARQCMEWFIGQRRANGYNAFACPSTAVPAACNVPSGYSISASINCASWNGDSSYKTVTVTVSGKGQASLSMQLGDY